jgi:hypothetical protein
MQMTKLKIKINENESYELNLPEEIEGESFLGIVERMNKVAKIILKEVDLTVPETLPQQQVVQVKKKTGRPEGWKKGVDFGVKSNGTKTYKDGTPKIAGVNRDGKTNAWRSGEAKTIRRRGSLPHTATREGAVACLNLHYHGTKEQKETYARSIGKTWIDISKSLFIVIRKYNIKPSEVGMIRFPYRNETAKRLKVENQ